MLKLLAAAVTYLMFTTSALACTWTYARIESYSVETCDPYSGCTQYNVEKYAWVCTGSGGTVSPPSTTPSTPTPLPPTGTPPTVDVVSVDDGSGYADISMTHSSNVTSLAILLNGTIVKQTEISGTGGTYRGPYIGNIRTGNSTLGVRVCTSGAQCAERQFNISRAVGQGGTNGAILATWADSSSGTPVMRTANYYHSLAATWKTTSFSGVDVVNWATRVWVTSGEYTMSYNDSPTTPYPLYIATLQVQGTGSGSQTGLKRMTSCSPSLISAYDNNISACATVSFFGNDPKIGVKITDPMSVQNSKGITSAVLAGNTLSFDPY